MFDNSGEKLRGLARVLFFLQVALAGIMLLVSLVAKQFLTGVISAAVMIFSAWISAVTITALGDAADYAQRSANYAYEILRRLDKFSPPAEAPKSYNAPQNNVAASYPQGNIPAWKRVEMEKQAQDQQPQ